MAWTRRWTSSKILVSPFQDNAEILSSREAVMTLHARDYVLRKGLIKLGTAHFYDAGKSCWQGSSSRNLCRGDAKYTIQLMHTPFSKLMDNRYIYIARMHSCARTHVLENCVKFARDLDLDLHTHMYKLDADPAQFKVSELGERAFRVQSRTLQELSL